MSGGSSVDTNNGNDPLIVMLAALILAGVGWSQRGRVRAAVVGWIREHGLLVDHPLVPCPGLDGLGLDIGRLIVAAGLLITTGALIWATKLRRTT